MIEEPATGTVKPEIQAYNVETSINLRPTQARISPDILAFLAEQGLVSLISHISGHGFKRIHPSLVFREAT